MLLDQGDLAEARSLYERALAIREKALGPEHPHTATILSNLASVLQKQGDGTHRSRQVRRSAPRLEGFL